MTEETKKVTNYNQKKKPESEVNAERGIQELGISSTSSVESGTLSLALFGFRQLIDFFVTFSYRSFYLFFWKRKCPFSCFSLSRKIIVGTNVS